MLIALITVVLASNKRLVPCELHFYRLRKEAVGEIGRPGSMTEICGRDTCSLVLGDVIANELSRI